MINYENAESPKHERAEYEMHESFLIKAVKCNPFIKPPRSIGQVSSKHPLSEPAGAGGDRVS